jgi:hypothetical protein
LSLPSMGEQLFDRREGAAVRLPKLLAVIVLPRLVPCPCALTTRSKIRPEPALALALLCLGRFGFGALL